MNETQIDRDSPSWADGVLVGLIIGVFTCAVFILSLHVLFGAYK